MNHEFVYQYAVKNSQYASKSESMNRKYLISLQEHNKIKEL